MTHFRSLLTEDVICNASPHNKMCRTSWYAQVVQDAQLLVKMGGTKISAADRSFHKCLKKRQSRWVVMNKHLFGG